MSHQEIEELAARRTADAAIIRRSRQLQRAEETLEKECACRAANAARVRRYRQQERAEETPEEACFSQRPRHTQTHIYRYIYIYIYISVYIHSGTKYLEHPSFTKKLAFA